MAVRGRDIQDFHNAIVHTVKTPDVVSELVSADVISSEDGNRIKHCFLNGELVKGCEEMMICFYKSTQPRKEQALLEAFKSAEYPYLKKLIEGEEYEDISHKHAKKILQIFTPKLEKQLQCLQILSDLYSRDVLSEDDMEYITAVITNKGNTYAMIVLLERMQCRVSPDKWYYDFLDVLLKNRYKHLVEELEPDFINNPSSFMPKSGPINVYPGKKSHQTAGPSSAKCEEFGSIHEHVLKDYAEGESSWNDLAVPPPPNESSDSLNLSRSNSRTESISNLQELNIKPNLNSKDLLITDGLFGTVGKAKGRYGHISAFSSDGSYVENRRIRMDKGGQVKRKNENNELRSNKRERRTGKGPWLNAGKKIKLFTSKDDEVCTPDYSDDEVCTIDYSTEETVAPSTDELEERKMNHENEDGEGDHDKQDSDASESSEDNSMASNYFSSDEEGMPELKLRNYQFELAENALLGRNTIICVETGSGKTWVALHIIKEHLKKACNVPQKVVFMARTGALIKQQFDRFQKYLPEFNSKLITGDDESRMLNMFVEGDYDILCFTPQILVNNLDDKLIKGLSVFSLLVLDECHHTRGDEPYNRLMRRYLIEKKNGVKNLPQVVGLTASIGVGKSRNETEAVEYILRVMACLDVELLSTVERYIDELKKHSNRPEEETIALRKLVHDPCKNIILQAMEQTEDMLEENAFLQPELIELITDKHPHNKESQEYNKWTVDVMKTAEMKVDDHDISRDISTCAKYLNIYNSALEINKLLTTRDVIKFLADKHRLESEHKDKLTQRERKLFDNLIGVQKNLSKEGRNIENPNVRILSDTLRTMIEQKGDESRAMVFVKARATCKSLAAFLDKDLEMYAVKASPFYGKENRGGDDGMSESVQTDVLDKFRSGVYKILVCTSVGNEGIDVPDCNIVLSYEYSADEVTKIQMKGRARKHGATAVVMGSENVMDQDRTNAFKASMMYKAMAKVKQQDLKVTQRKIAMYQQEEMNKHHWKVEVDQMKKGRKSEGDYKLLCKRCNVVACYASDVRQMGHDHIVIDRDFTEKINRKPHNKPKTYDGISKKYKMYCKKCPLDWGIIGTRDGLECMILKIQSFKFQNLRTNGIEMYKKWIDVPYKVPEVKLEDLRLTGDTVENTKG